MPASTWIQPWRSRQQRRRGRASMSAKSGADSRARLASGAESACAKARRHQADKIVHVFFRGGRATPRTLPSGRPLRLVRQGSQLGSSKGKHAFRGETFRRHADGSSGGICIACSAWNQGICQTAKRRCGLGELLVCCDQAGAVLEGQNQVSGVVDTQRQGHGLIQRCGSEIKGAGGP
jgi:hypothetical protein